MALYIKKGITMKFPQAPIKKIVLLTDFTDASTDASYHAMLQAQTYKALKQIPSTCLLRL